MIDTPQIAQAPAQHTALIHLIVPGLAIEIRHEPYDWSSPELLRGLALSLGAREAVVAGSSEGGLFEYGSDEHIVANLKAFHEATGKDAVIVGTVTRADGSARILNEAGGAAIRLRGLEAFSTLAGSAEWHVARVVDSPLSHDVVLVKRQPYSKATSST